MKRLYKIIILIIISVNAYPDFRNSFIGARPLAMGGAFTAVADDIYSIYWNPAGLVFLDNKSFSFDLSYTDLYRSGAREMGFISGSRYKKYGGGILWHRTGISGIYSEDIFLISGNRELISNSLSVGGTIKLLKAQTPLYNVQATNISFDLGIIYAISSKIRFGLVLKDPFEPSFKMIESSPTAEKIYREIRVGAAYKPLRMALISFDISRYKNQNTLNIGAELLFAQIFKVRFGLNNFKPDFGIGFAGEKWYFDIGFYQSYSLGLKTRANIGYKFSL